MQMELLFGSRQLVVEVSREQRKTLSITVHPDLRITAKAPMDYELNIIRKRLEKRARWIVRQLNFFEQFQPLPTERQFVSGETHYYLGRQYRLKIRFGEKAQVKLIGRFFEMELPNPSDREQARKLMLDWYFEHAKNIFLKRFQIYWPRFFKMGISEPTLRVRRMKQRWGSCSKEKSLIILNIELIHASITSIDYVIVHELTHLVVPYHNQRFYQILENILPDWEKRRERLNNILI